MLSPGRGALDRSSRGLSLLTVRLLVDDRLTFAVALIDGSRPAVEQGCAKAIERDVSEVALVDANRGKTAAVSARKAGGLELARTSLQPVAWGPL
jgi:hypothetical protein